MSKDGILVRYPTASPPIAILIALNCVKDSLAHNNITLKLVPKNTKEPAELTKLPAGYVKLFFIVFTILQRYPYRRDNHIAIYCKICSK